MTPAPSQPQPTHPKPIYFVSGLGADERIFQWLTLEGYHPVHIRWIPPKKGEAIADYAQRLTPQITTEKPVLIGLSFGGMIAIEIAKHLETEQVILISSVKDTSEVPVYFKVFRALPIHRIFPYKSLLWACYGLARWLFAPKGDAQTKLFKQILQDTDPHFLKWALHRVVIWNNQIVPQNIAHVHGKGDRIFPWAFVEPTHTLDGTGHLMVMNQADTVSNLLMALMDDAKAPLTQA